MSISRILSALTILTFVWDNSASAQLENEKLINAVFDRLVIGIEKELETFPPKEKQEFLESWSEYKALYAESQEGWLQTKPQTLGPLRSVHFWMQCVLGKRSLMPIEEKWFAFFSFPDVELLRGTIEREQAAEITDRERRAYLEVMSKWIETGDTEFLLNFWSDTVDRMLGILMREGSQTWLELLDTNKAQQLISVLAWMKDSVQRGEANSWVLGSQERLVRGKWSVENVKGKVKEKDGLEKQLFLQARNTVTSLLNKNTWLADKYFVAYTSAVSEILGRLRDLLGNGSTLSDNEVGSILERLSSLNAPSYPELTEPLKAEKAKEESFASIHEITALLELENPAQILRKQDFSIAEGLDALESISSQIGLMPGNNSDSATTVRAAVGAALRELESTLLKKYEHQAKEVK